MFCKQTPIKMTSDANASHEKATNQATMNNSEVNHSNGIEENKSIPNRPVEELKKLVQVENFDPTSLSNEETIELMLSLKESVYRLERFLGKSNAKRCVEIRRQYYLRELQLLDDEEKQPEPRANILRRPQTTEFNYERVVGACCENVIGYVRLPVGLVGPLRMDKRLIYIPLATTEGCLVASTSRGVSALNKAGGVETRVWKDSMTRAPIVRFQDLDTRDKALEWLRDPINEEKMKAAFRSTSKHTTLVGYTLHPLGREIHIRFDAYTGDAMGMNMCSKGAEAALREMQRIFPMEILTLSGNMCTDKKPSAINWVCGRGKSVECYALIPAEVVEKVFKVSVDSLIKVWLEKVMIGGAMAGSIGGFNCQAANIVAAIFIATGQDVAQVVSSSNCILKLEKDLKGALAVTCSMPSIECGTVGGGTVLPDQSNYLQLMGIKGTTTSSQDPISSSNNTGVDSDSNACKLARAICSTVMAADLSLLASLTEGTLVKSHMTHNRSTQPCKVV